MFKRVTVIAALLLFPAAAAQAQTPSPDAMSAARTLVTTLKLSDQYKALLPVILLSIKPGLTQDRPKNEQGYNSPMAAIAGAHTPYYNSTLDAAATINGAPFTADEFRQIAAFYR